MRRAFQRATPDRTRATEPRRDKSHPGLKEPYPGVEDCPEALSPFLCRQYRRRVRREPSFCVGKQGHEKPPAGTRAGDPSLSIASQEPRSAKDDEMVIALFEYRLRADIDVAEWEQTFGRMVALASEAPGCISIDGYASPDGVDLAVNPRMSCAASSGTSSWGL